MPRELLDKVEATARKLGISKSGYIRYILIREFAKHESRVQSTEPQE
jgi:hypothetical protein